MKIILLPILAMLSACNHQQASDESETKSPPLDIKTVKVSIEPIKKDSFGSIDTETLRSRDKIIAKLDNTRTVRLNGEKFKLLSPNLNKGARVFNLVMNEQGTVKGTIVVITTLKALSPKLSGINIAKNTFRIKPSKEQSLKKLYQELNQSTDYSVVELEIDYSPINTHPVQ